MEYYHPPIEPIFTSHTESVVFYANRWKNNHVTYNDADLSEIAGINTGECSFNAEVLARHPQLVQAAEDYQQRKLNSHRSGAQPEIQPLQAEDPLSAYCAALRKQIESIQATIDSIEKTQHAQATKG